MDLCSEGIFWRVLNISGVHAYMPYMHAPLVLEIWSSGLAQYNMTLKACSQKYHHSGSRETQLHVSCLCFGKLHWIPWRLCAMRFQQCQKKTQLQRAGRSWAEVLGKRKGKLINLSCPSSKLECNRLLYTYQIIVSQQCLISLYVPISDFGDKN